MSLPAQHVPLERVLVVRLGSMGDIIHTLPAVATLREALPQATIGWVVEDRWVELLSSRGEIAKPRGPGKPLVDDIHAVSTRAWRKSLASRKTWSEIRAATRQLRAGNYQLAIDFQGAIRSAAIAILSRARVRVGFSSPREKPATLLYTQTVRARSRHVLQQNLELVREVCLGAESVERAELPADYGTELWADREVERRGLQNGFALINPGAGWRAKQWPAERYSQVACGLAELGLRSLINCGPGENALAREVEAKSGGVAQGLTCGITELIAITCRARLFIGGDTGPTHLAAALGVPVVALFGPTDPERNGPYGTQSVVLRSHASLTTYTHAPKPDPGLLTITPDEVLSAARHLLLECCQQEAR